MEYHLIAIGNRMPAWVDQGYDEYAKRFPKHAPLRLTEIPAGKRSKGADLNRIIHKEGEQMLAAIPPQSKVIALDMRGQQWDTLQLSTKMKAWQQNSPKVCFLIGGPEGLAPAVLARADSKLSLSHFTLPHPLVRLFFAEQLYRAWTLLIGHPYHK